MVVLSGAGVRLSPDTTRTPPDSFHARAIFCTSRLRPLSHDRAHVTPQSPRVPNPSVRRSPYGDVQLGDVREVLTYPGRCLNDHCLIRHDGLWHFFGLIGDVTGPGEMHGV